MKTLCITWQRLADGQGGTCPRCAGTGEAVAESVERLAQALRPLGLGVRAERRELSAAEFAADPSASNRIWIGHKPIEAWLGATTGHSACCGPCGDAQCRTLEIRGVRYEAIPTKLILKAGLLAAAELLSEGETGGET